MFDRDLLQSILEQINFAIDRIFSASKNIHTANDYALTSVGMEHLESTCMLLTAIGESIKNIDKRTDKKFLISYPSIEWQKIMRMRDIIVHHYFDIDMETVFDVVKNKLPDLKTTIQQMLIDIKQM